MNLTGIWKPYGRYAMKERKITIQDQELTFWIDVVSPNPKQTTVHFHLTEERCLRENQCYNIEIEEEQFKNTDYIVHEEMIGEKPVVILSHMAMELDGRGRIVISSYVREEDYALVNDEFESLAYQYWNNRPSIPMTQINPNGNAFLGMMGEPITMGMMQGNMPGLMGGTQTPPAPPTPPAPVDPWDCICGKKQITGRFCPECGMPMPKQ